MTVGNMANIDCPSFIAERSDVSEVSSVEKVNQSCDFWGTEINKHTPPSLLKVINHSSSPWSESIRDEFFIAKRERRQAERKTKLTIFKDLYRQAKHKVSKNYKKLCRPMTSSDVGVFVFFYLKHDS